jgi:hypothetical protein
MDRQLIPSQDCGRIGPRGPPRGLADGLREWMEEHEYSSIRMMQGSLNQQSAPHQAAFERSIT